MAIKSRITRAKVKRALTENRANVMAAARSLGCAPLTIYRYINRYPDVEEALHLGRRAVVDIAQAQLMRHITEVNDGYGDLRAIMFVLKTWGKGDGWTERTEHTGADGEPIAVRVDDHLDPAVRQRLIEAGYDPDDLLADAIASLQAVAIAELVNHVDADPAD